LSERRTGVFSPHEVASIAGPEETMEERAEDEMQRKTICDKGESREQYNDDRKRKTMNIGLVLQLQRR
jgi:hypothetical protein